MQARARRSTLGGLGVRLLIATGAFTLVEHPIAPRALAAPMHVHEREDEYSFVLAGRVGFQLGDDVVIAGPGDLVHKPRGQWHAFWNAGDEPARVLELISPGGFEHYFAELAPLLPPHVPAPDMAALALLQRRYGMTMDFTSMGRLIQEHGLAPVS